MMTLVLKEYLEDYASADTRKKGEEVIKNEIPKIPNEKVKKIVIEHLEDLHEGKRDFRF